MQIKVALYVLSFATSLACTLLLARGWARTRQRLLLWSAIGFAFLSVNNLLLFVDLVMLPDADLRVFRLGAALLGVAFILWAFVWDTE